MTKISLNSEQKTRLESLEQDVEALTEGKDPSIPTPEFPEDFLARLVKQSTAQATLPIKYLERCGYVVPPPSELDDDALKVELWRVIWAMALLRLFLDHTDHMTDRELYTYIYEDCLREPTAFMPGQELPVSYFIDPLSGGGSKEDDEKMLSYYRDRLDDAMIELLLADFDEAPEIKERPADRDRFMP